MHLRINNIYFVDASDRLLLAAFCHSFQAASDQKT